MLNSKHEGLALEKIYFGNRNYVPQAANALSRISIKIGFLAYEMCRQYSTPANGTHTWSEFNRRNTLYGDPLWDKAHMPNCVANDQTFECVCLCVCVFDHAINKKKSEKCELSVVLAVGALNTKLLGALRIFYSVFWRMNVWSSCCFRQSTFIKIACRMRPPPLPIRITQCLSAISLRIAMCFSIFLRLPLIWACVSVSTLAEIRSTSRLATPISIVIISVRTCTSVQYVIA